MRRGMTDLKGSDVPVTNVLFLVFFTAVSMFAGPATKVVTELMARGVVAQDEGVAKPPAVPQSAPTKNQAALQLASPSVPVLATAAIAHTPPAVTASVSANPAPIPDPTALASLIAAAPPSAALLVKATATVPAIQSGAVQSETAHSGAVQSGTIQSGTIQSGTGQAGAVQAGAGQSAAADPGADLNPSATLLALTGDTPTRRADGSVFLPITLQRMIGMRTEITQVEQVAATQEVAGRIVTSRNVGALIQATQSGVIEAVDGQVPRVGMRVTAGELLATQRPIIDAARQVEINAKIADLKGMIDMGEQRVARLKEVYLIRYRQSKIDAMEAEIDNYRRQLHIYETLATERVEIRAQSNGVISRVNFVAGQIVEPQTTLFEIVDPTRLWVEAASFDPALTTDIASATALTVDGRVLKLRFTGGGLMLQNQAVPLQFDILSDVGDLQIGTPVTVIVKRRQSETAGIRLPRAAVLHGATGETIVWERLSAEAFIARPVNMAPLDGNDVVVTSGLTANMRIVTAASEALTQVR